MINPYDTQQGPTQGELNHINSYGNLVNSLKGPSQIDPTQPLGDKDAIRQEWLSQLAGEDPELFSAVQAFLNNHQAIEKYRAQGMPETDMLRIGLQKELGASIEAKATDATKNMLEKEVEKGKRAAKVKKAITSLEDLIKMRQELQQQSQQ